ncbi:MAG: 5'-3' exonuclease H3TH domain-containing protein [bacterium]|nr:5'-3' exonuclease H3TH domain-containing protein [bacterium]
MDPTSLKLRGTKTLVLIDSNAIIHRAYHALPKTMSLSNGEMTNAVYGYTTTLIKVLEDLKPDYIAATFDLAGPTFRHDEYKEYKATRVKADQELYDQIPRVRELLETLNIPVYEKEGFEADDVIGTIVQLSQKSEIRNPKSETNAEIQNSKFKIQIYIVTGDKDAFQLIDGNIFVYNLKHGLSNAQIVDRTEIKKDWNLQPEDFIDLKALAGDPSDNIPGVPGIGVKTATNLLIKFDSLKKLYEKIIFSCHSEVPAEESQEILHYVQDDKTVERIAKQLNIKPRILKLLIENKDQAFLSQRLATIRRDVPIDFKLEDCHWGDYDKGKVKDFFEKMRFHSLLRRFGAEKAEPVSTKPAEQQKEKDKQLQLL